MALLTATLVGITMILGTAASLWQMSKAIGERNAKDAALQEATQANAEAIAAKQKVEQFAEDLVRANELVVSGQAHADAGRWADASRDYEAAVAVQPNYYLPRVQRAQLFTRLGLWPEAAEDYAMAIQTGASTSHPQWWGVPALFLYTGYDDAFMRISGQRRDEILRDPTNPQWMLLRDLAVSDEPTSPIEHKALVEIAQQWMSERRFPGRKFPGEPRPPHLDPNSRRHEDRLPGEPDRPPRHDQFGRVVQPDNTPLCVRQYVTAMAHLRAEEFDPAIELLLKAARDPRWPSKYLVHAPMALAHYHNGDVARASEALDRSDVAIQELLSAFGERPLQSTETPWFDLVEGLQINREASQVIRGTPSSLTSQLDQRRAASLNLLKGRQPKRFFARRSVAEVVKTFDGCVTAKLLTSSATRKNTNRCLPGIFE